MANAEQVADALSLLGAAYRSDWSDLDGRSLRSQLDELATTLRKGELFNVEGWAYGLGICPTSKGWVTNCDNKRPGSHYSTCKHEEEYYESLAPKENV